MDEQGTALVPTHHLFNPSGRESLSPFLMGVRMARRSICIIGYHVDSNKARELMSLQPCPTDRCRRGRSTGTTWPSDMACSLELGIDVPAVLPPISSMQTVQITCLSPLIQSLTPASRGPDDKTVLYDA